MYYDREVFLPQYIIFNNISDKQLKTVEEFMTPLKINRLDWPGTTFINTIKKVREQGYRSMITVVGEEQDKPYTIDEGILFTAIRTHLQSVCGKNAIDGLRPEPYVQLEHHDRWITKVEDYRVLFNKALSICETRSIHASFATAYNKNGLWGLGPVGEDFDLTRLTSSVISIGRGEEFLFDVTEKGSLRTVLNDLFGIK